MKSFGVILLPIWAILLSNIHCVISDSSNTVSFSGSAVEDSGERVSTFKKNVGDLVVDKSIKIPLLHSLGDELGLNFTTAGFVTGKLKSTARGSQKLKNAQVDRRELSEEEAKAFQALVDSDGYYRVQTQSNIHGSKRFVLSSVKARCLLSARFVESIVLHMDGNGNIEALNYIPQADCSEQQDARKVGRFPFRSSVLVKRGAKADNLVPSVEKLEPLKAPMSAPSQPTELGKEGEGPKQPPPPKTFWEKYWLYIIPLGVVLLNTIASGQAEGAKAAAAARAQRRNR